MEIWIPFVSSQSAVINFDEPRAWDKIEDALVCNSVTSWTPMNAFIAKGVPDGFVYAGGVLVCDSFTWHLLADRLKNEVEPLLLSVNSKSYYMLHIINMLPCLNMNKSKVFRSPFDGSIMEILHYNFDASSLDDVFLFRIPEKPQEVFATSLFRNLIKDNNVHNLDFQHISHSISVSGDTL